MKYRRATIIQIVGFSVATTIAAADAHAQDPIDNAVAHVGIGAGINRYDPTNRDGQTSQGVTLVWRWHSFHSGWGPTIGIDWHTTDFDQTLGGLDAPLGSLRMRALLVGIGHTGHLGRLSASASVGAGYAFNNFTVASDAVPTFASTGFSLTGVDIDDSFVLKPDVAVWYDVFRHVGVGVSAAYLVARPDEHITTGTGTQVHHLKADAFELTAGVTFGVWKKKKKS